METIGRNVKPRAENLEALKTGSVIVAPILVTLFYRLTTKGGNTTDIISYSYLCTFFKTPRSQVVTTGGWKRRRS